MNSPVKHANEQAQDAAVEPAIGWQLVGETGLAVNLSTPIAEGATHIGRDANNDLVLSSSHVDLHAASIHSIDGKVHIQSHSIEPIYIDGNALEQAQRVALIANSLITIDVYRFKLTPVLTQQPDQFNPDEAHKRVQELSDQSTPDRSFKTKPTSPGNRTETTYGDSDLAKNLAMTAAIVVVIAAATLVMLAI